MTEQDTILIESEAMALAKISSKWTFKVWRQRWKVRAHKGRYSRQAIEHAMHREATALRRKVL